MPPFQLAIKNNAHIVACNVYVSAGRQNTSSVLLNLLCLAQERCSLLRQGLYTSSAAFFQERRHLYSTEGPPQITIVHAYADSSYDRSSFHLAGCADIVADVASYIALAAVDRLSTFKSQTVSERSASERHPSVGIVDHVSVMPLYSSENPSITGHDIYTSQTKDNMYVPPDIHGIAASYIGQSLSMIGVKVLYYGSANPNGTPLATVRRENTAFFQSGGLSKSKDTALSDKFGVCTVGSPPKFAENFNIRLTARCSKKMAMSLTQKIRERDGGLKGVEALTLPYANGQYEIAANLLCPEVASVDNVLRLVDEWVFSQILEFNNDRPNKLQAHLDTKDFVDVAYRVGTTEDQCLAALNAAGNYQILAHDKSVTDRFRDCFKSST